MISNRISGHIIGLLCLLFVPLHGQGKAKDPTQAAIKAYRAVQKASDSKRSSKLAALGYHGGAEIEKILLHELRSAKTSALRRVAADALGRKLRNSGPEPLIDALRREQKDYYLQRAVAKALSAQGKPGIDRLIDIATDGIRSDKGQAKAIKNLRNASLYGLSFAGTPKAWRALVSCATADTASTTDRRIILAYLRKAPPSPALDSLRLEGARSQDLLTSASSVRQLAEHGHPKAKALILRLHKKSLPGRSRIATPVAVRTDLVYAMVAALSRGLYQPMVMQFAYSSEGTDKAQKAVSKTVASNTKFVRWMSTRGLKLESVSERIVIVRLLGQAIDIPDQTKITDTLIKLARSSDAPVAYAAIRSLGKRGDKSVIPRLKRILRSPGDERRIETVLALHDLSKADPTWGELLTELLEKRDNALHATALDLLAELGSKAGLPYAYEDMQSKSWARRAAAYDYCRVVRSTETIPHLIERISAERGRLREDVLDTLLSLTALRFHNADRWEQWWDRNQMSFELVPVKKKPKKSKAKAKDKTTTYYNIPLVSDRVAFVVDTSGSMNAKIGTGKRSRLDEAKRQLERVIKAMPKHFRFNIVFFHTGVSALWKVMADADPKSRKRALEDIKKAKAAGSTNIFGAMKKAFEDPDIDTIYLLSDGYPSAGAITDATALAAEIERWNRARQIRIHCIAIGQDSTLLKRIAKNAGGQYAYFR